MQPFTVRSSTMSESRPLPVSRLFADTRSAHRFPFPAADVGASPLASVRLTASECSVLQEEDEESSNNITVFCSCAIIAILFKNEIQHIFLKRINLASETHSDKRIWT